MMVGLAGSEPCPRQDGEGEFGTLEPLVLSALRSLPNNHPLGPAEEDGVCPPSPPISIDLPRKRQKGFSLAGGIWGRGIQKSRG